MQDQHCPVCLFFSCAREWILLNFSGTHNVANLQQTRRPWTTGYRLLHRLIYILKRCFLCGVRQVLMLHSLDCVVRSSPLIASSQCRWHQMRWQSGRESFAGWTADVMTSSTWHETLSLVADWQFQQKKFVFLIEISLYDKRNFFRAPPCKKNRTATVFLCWGVEYSD